MVSINYSAREVCCKIVYYGPGLSGKTTNLQYVHAKVPGDSRGKLISLATEADRTLYFDFLPINIGSINGFAAKFQLYTVPGQVYYNATRKLVLRGVDGIVFVADSQPDKMDENIESLLNLEENLKEYGYSADELPMVIQYNKCDLPGILSPTELNARLNPRNWPWFEASATIGNGVFDTLKMIIKLVLEKAKKSDTSRSQPSGPSATVDSPAASVGEGPAPPTPAKPSVIDREPPTSVPQPVPVGSGGPAMTPSASAPVAASVESPVEARPFPGDQTGSLNRRHVNPENLASSPAPSPSEKKPVQSDQAEATAEASPGTPNDLATPSMAPPLRKRPAKKRGFFKRLFGIK